MVQKRKPESSEFFEAWVKYKIHILSNLVRNVDYEMPSFVPDWKYDWCQAWNVRYDSWDDFLTVRSKEIETFMETGDLEFDALPFVDIVGGPGMFEVLKKDCNDLIKIIENSSHVKDKIRFLHSIEKIILIIESAWENLLGRHLLKCDQKEERSNSGIGQKKAQAERQAKLVESLRQYEKGDCNEIGITKRDFGKLLDQTFVGSENYARHPSTIKKYREEAGKILGEKIIFQRK